MEAVARPPLFEYGAAALARPGERESGDCHVVADFAGGVLVAMIDALGHGHPAALAAEVAAGLLARHANEPPRALIERCHEALRGLRGAAMSVASFDWRQRTLTWLGVGNVEGLFVCADRDARPRVQPLLLRGGVVGDRLPELRPLTLPVSPGDVLVLATDGVRETFGQLLPSAAPPGALAQRILDEHARRDDDAAVLVFRVDGGR